MNVWFEEKLTVMRGVTGSAKMTFYFLSFWKLDISVDAHYKLQFTNYTNYKLQFTIYNAEIIASSKMILSELFNHTNSG